MSVAKVIEIIAVSKTSFEDAVATGIARVADSVTDVKSAWVKDQSVDVVGGKITAWKATLKVTFVVKDGPAKAKKK